MCWKIAGFASARNHILKVFKFNHKEERKEKMEEKENTKLADFERRSAVPGKTNGRAEACPWSDLFEMTDQEAKKYVTKDNVWHETGLGFASFEGNTEKSCPILAE